MSSAAEAFHRLEPPPRGTSEVYAVARIGSLNGHSVYVAKSWDEAPAFLVEGGPRTHRAPVTLRHVDMTFRTRTQLRLGNVAQAVEATVVVCKSLDAEVQAYFIRLLELMLCAEMPAASADLGERLEVVATLFQRLSSPRSKEAQGLFGELVVIAESGRIPAMLRGWHADPMERFDFAWGAARLEVKTSARRVRKHRFSQAQCEPPDVGVLASLFVERSAGGTTIADQMDRISRSASAFPDLIIKMQIVVRSSLGSDAIQELSQGYDLELAANSLEFFDLASIPAIRGVLPDGVSELSFSANVEGCERLPLDALQEIVGEG